jgi:Fic family protein
MLGAIRETADWTAQKVKAIHTLMEFTVEHAKAQELRGYSRELIELIFTQPYCRITNVVEAQIAKRQTAATYLRGLCEIGILKEYNANREKLFIHPRLLQLLISEDPEVLPYDSSR